MSIFSPYKSIAIVKYIVLEAIYFIGRPQSTIITIDKNKFTI